MAFSIRYCDFRVIYAILLSGFTLENQDGHSIAWLLTLPQSRVRIFNAKWLASVSRGLIIVLTIVSLVVSVGLFRDGIGQGEFPVLHYDKAVNNPYVEGDFASAFHFDSMYVQLIQIALLRISMLMFISILAIVFSLLIKRYSHFILVLSLVLVGGYILCTHPSISNIGQFFPFFYLNVSGIVNGVAFLGVGGNSLGFIHGLSINLLFSALLYSIGIIVMKRNRFKKGGI